MSTIDDLHSATFAAQSYDATIAEAWASSPLGDPEDEFLSHPAKFEDFPPTTVTAKPRSRGTNVLVGGAVVAAIGMVAGLGLMLLDGSSKQEKPAVVVPDSSVGTVAPQAPSAVPPSPVAATPPGQGPTGPGGDAPALSGPAPAPGPGERPRPIQAPRRPQRLAHLP
jgi:hypothetical protein